MSVASMLADAAEIMQVHDMMASYMDVHDVSPACMAAGCRLLYDEIVESATQASMKQLPVPMYPESKNWTFGQCKDHVMMSVDNMSMIMKYLKDLIRSGREVSKMSPEELELVLRELKTRLKGAERKIR